MQNRRSVHTPPASALRIRSTVSSSLSTMLGPDAGTSIAVQSRSSGSSEELTRVMSTELDSVEAPSTNGNYSSSTQSFIKILITSMNSAPSTTTPSPSSSSGVSTCADSYKKSTLNPNAKEFKLNPNAKSFTPRFTPARPPSLVVQGPVYVPGVMPSVAQIQGMPVGVIVNPLLPSVGQSGTNYVPYNPVAVEAAAGTNPYLPSPGTYTSGVSAGAAVSPVLGGHSTIKVPPQLEQPVAGQSYGSQQPISYTSQVPSVQPTSTYLHPSGHLYSQQQQQKDEANSRNGGDASHTYEEVSYLTCSICLTNKPRNPVLTCCGHVFCWACVYRWFSVKKTCPTCKGRLSSAHDCIPILGISGCNNNLSDELREEEYTGVRIPPCPPAQRKEQEDQESDVEEEEEEDLDELEESDFEEDEEEEDQDELEESDVEEDEEEDEEEEEDDQDEEEKEDEEEEEDQVLHSNSFLHLKNLSNVDSRGLGSLTLRLRQLVAFYVERLVATMEVLISDSRTGDSPTLSPLSDYVDALSSSSSFGALNGNIGRDYSDHNLHKHYVRRAADAIERGFFKPFGLERDLSCEKIVLKGMYGSPGGFFKRDDRYVALWIDDPFPPGVNIAAGSFGMVNMQVFAPLTQKSTCPLESLNKDDAVKNENQESTSSVFDLEDGMQQSASIDIWKKAFLDALQKLCPVRVGGKACSCIPGLPRLVIEECIYRLDALMFNAILPIPNMESRSNLVSEAQFEAQVLPIPPGRLTFGAGVQLKNVVGTWSTWLTILLEKLSNTVANTVAMDESRRFLSFPLLKALADLLMLPRDMVADKSVRKETSQKDEELSSEMLAKTQPLKKETLPAKPSTKRDKKANYASLNAVMVLEDITNATKEKLSCEIAKEPMIQKKSK